MKKYLMAAITIVALLATFAGGCLNTTKEESTGERTGILKLNLSDAPINASEVTGFHITIKEIQYNLNGEWITTREFDKPQSYNLLDLTGGNFVSLGEFTLPAGYYVQIRFILDISEYGSTPVNPGCYIEYKDGSDKPLVAPSGGETGFKAIGAFEVPVDGTVEVTADFDIQEAIVEAGQSGVYILKPTIRLVQNDQTGNISGSITDGSIYEDILIFVYEDGAWTAGQEGDAQIGYKSRFPKAITFGKMDDDGNYNLPLLEAGTYDLVVAGFNGYESEEMLGFASDVKVRNEQTTIQDIDIPLPAAPTEIVAFEGNRGILLEWANNTETDLAGYKVYCSAASGGPYVKIAEVKVSRYNDNGLTNGLTYYYVITAFDDSNNESVYSKEIPATPSS